LILLFCTLNEIVLLTLDDTLLQHPNLLSKYEDLTVLNSFDKEINFIPHYKFSSLLIPSFQTSTLLYFNLVLSIYPYYYSLILLPLPTLLCIRPILFPLRETEQINYRLYNLIYRNIITT